MDLLVVPLVRELVSADARHVVFELRQHVHQRERI
jgi:hypothetical protein